MTAGADAIGGGTAVIDRRYRCPDSWPVAAQAGNLHAVSPIVGHLGRLMEGLLADVFGVSSDMFGVSHDVVILFIAIFVLSSDIIIQSVVMVILSVAVAVLSADDLGVSHAICILSGSENACKMAIWPQNGSFRHVN